MKIAAIFKLDLVRIYVYMFYTVRLHKDSQSE